MVTSLEQLAYVGSSLVSKSLRLSLQTNRAAEKSIQLMLFIVAMLLLDLSGVISMHPNHGTIADRHAPCISNTLQADEFSSS